MTAVALTIAGSDSSGGAGIQADLKTFSALGAYGCSVIAALTAQNRQGVQAIQPVPAAFIAAQIDSVMGDLRVDAVKIGMLGTPEVIETVAEGLGRWPSCPAVLDPVMVAKGGARLLMEDAILALRRSLLPLATLVTPNLPEASALLGEGPIRDRAAMSAAAARLLALGARNVLLKGGHLDGPDSPDLLLHDGREIWLEGRRVATSNTHGTGCTLSSAIAALLAQGLALPEAVTRAKRWLEGAIAMADALEIGRRPEGHGPVHHFHALWREQESLP